MRDMDKAQDHHRRIMEKIDGSALLAGRRHFIQGPFAIISTGRMGDQLVHTWTNDLEHHHTSAALNLGYN